MRRQKLLMEGLFVSCILLILSFGHATINNRYNDERVVRIGHANTPFLTELYVATGHDIFEEHEVKVELKRFGSTTEIGYALLAGDIDRIHRATKDPQLVRES